MIRVLFKQLLDDKSFREKRRITISEVADVTNVSRATLTRVANTPGYNTNTDTLNALCKYFGCTAGELITYIPDEEE